MDGEAKPRETRPIRVGLNVSPQNIAWAEVADTVSLADAVGIDSLWTWDHLYGVAGPHQGIFDGWALVSAWAALTRVSSIGLLVCANTFRNPGVVAKAAVTVDHISDGRFILGMGSAYQAAEHLAHGIAFGAGPGERLAWLDESLSVIRSLLAGETVTSPPDARYSLDHARHLPGPVAGRLRILVGGGGERRTIPIVARHADLWHVRGDVETLRRKLEILELACARQGRAVQDVELVIGNPVIIRDDPDEALRAYRSRLDYNDQTLETAPGTPWMGPPERIAELWLPFARLGFLHLIADLPTPHDHETVERLADVGRLVAGAS